MKIYEIIAEDYDNLALLNTPDTANAAAPTDNPTTSQATTSGQLKSTVKAVTDFLPDIGIDYGTVALTAAGVGVGALAIEKMSTAALSALSSNYAKKLRLTNQVNAMWTNRFGIWSKVFGVIGVSTALTQLYENLYVLEAMYVQGKLPGEDGGYAKLVEQREFEFGVFTTQVLAPTVTKWTLRTIATLTGVRLLIRVLGGVTVGATLGASIAAIIASEAFTRWFQWWLGSEQGRKVLYDYLGGVVRTFGTPTESLWSLIMDSYNSADKKKFDSPEAAKTAQTDRVAATPSISGQTGKTGFVTDPNKDASGNLINPTTKIVVTDKDGNLLPNARLMANAQLNLIRSQAIKAGQPDPLAKFAAPGQALPQLR